MTLDPQDYKQYLETSLQLLYYVGKTSKVFPAKTSYEEFLKLNSKFECRQAMYKNMNLLDEHLQAYKGKLSTDQTKIILGYKKKIQSNFVVFRYLKQFAIFMNIENNKFYTVTALGEPFDNFFPQLPVICGAVILPFKNKIIYDGFLTGGSVHVGSHMKAEINEDYKKAKQEKQIITTL